MLDELAHAFSTHGFDLKFLIRAITATRAYQLTSRGREPAEPHLFVRMPWATHGCDKSFAGPCGQIITYAVERFLDSVMTAPSAAKPPAGERQKNAAASKSAASHAKKTSQPKKTT